MAAGERHIAVIQIEVLRVGGPAAGLAREAAWRVARAIGKVLRESVRTLELQPVRETLVHRDGQRVIVTSRAVHIVGDMRPDGEGRGGFHSVESDGIGRHLIQIDAVA